MPGLKILQNVNIVSFSQFLFGPACAQYLADMGANVIKVEPPHRGAFERRWSGGRTFPGGVSAFFLLANRNVRSLTLDLHQEAGRTAARELIGSSDVVIENLRPGAMKRLGLDHTDLREEHPGLIYASGSAYGSEPEYQDLPGQDLLLQAATGLASITGAATHPPVTAGSAVVDQHAAALLSMGILGALYHRESTGEGQRIEVTMAEAALDLQSEPLVYHLNGGKVERPYGPISSSFHEAPYGIYETSDGYVAISLSPVELVAEALDCQAELEEFRDPDLAFSRREEIAERLSALLKGWTTADLLAALRRKRVWATSVNDYDAALADPAIDHLDPLLELDHPDAGRVTVLKHPVRYSGGEATVIRTPPQLGQHTSEVLGELGYTDSEISDLREEGAV